MIVDDTRNATARSITPPRAPRTRGGLVLLGVLELEDAHQQWLGVADLMRAEATEAAQRRLDDYVARARQVAGITAETVIREGNRHHPAGFDRRDRDIAILVLAAGIHRDGPARW